MLFLEVRLYCRNPVLLYYHSCDDFILELNLFKILKIIFKDTFRPFASISSDPAPQIRMDDPRNIVFAYAHPIFDEA